MGEETRGEKDAMPLASYGVVIGTLDHFRREDPTHFGTYYPGMIYLATPVGRYECAVDVATPAGIKVQYRVIPNLDATLFAPIAARADGFHALARTPDSRALDYARSPLLTPAGRPAPWIDSTGDNALDELEAHLTGSARVYVFGEPYTHGLGVHNAHQNQGDPPGIHQGDDGIWQDGGTIVARPDGTLVAILTKFETQSLRTDDQGLPL
jgi:hypothetical protein